MPCARVPPASCRGPCQERSGPGGVRPPWQPVCVNPSSRKEFVARCDAWQVPLKCQETHAQAPGLGWHRELYCPALEKGAEVMSQGPFLAELLQAEVCRVEQPGPTEPVLPGGGKHHPRQTWAGFSCVEHH